MGKFKKVSYGKAIFCFSVSLISGLFFLQGHSFAAVNVPLHGLFEISIINNVIYANKFRDVDLNATFTSPSGKVTPFWGFFDGDGSGGPDSFDANNPPVDNGGELTGTVWKLRFMPDELGTWNYTWSFSDGSKSGSGTLNVISTGEKPGVLKPLSSNFHWFQQPDGTPFFPKLYYPIAGEQLSYDVSVYGPGVYQKAIDRGYNMIMINALPLWDWNTNQGNSANGPMDTNFLVWYQSKPYQGETDDGTVYDTNRFNLFAYKRLEQHVRWLADRGISLMMFQGFAVKRTLPTYRQPDKFPADKADWFIKYQMARLAPYWNMMWNYTWEVNPGTEATDSFGTLIDKYDPWDHLYTAESLGDGNFSNSVYDISTIEVDPDSIPNYYSYGKPINMIEDGGPLWQYDAGLDANALDKAWRLISQGAFFGWAEFVGTAKWRSTRLWSNYFSTSMSQYITTLYNFIGNETNFAALKPHRELVDNGAYALADLGKEYVVYKPNGGTFNVNLAAGSYNVVWVDPFTNGRTQAPTVAGGGQVQFTTPTAMHFVLFLSSGVTDTLPPSVPTGLFVE